MNEMEISLLRQALSPSHWYESLPKSITLENWQREVLESPKKRIILNIHRQGGKSFVCSILLAHRLLFYPSSLCISSAVAERQAQEMVLRVLNLLEQAGKTEEIREKGKSHITLRNGSRLIGLPSNSEAVRGYSSPDLIVEDESGFCEDSLYRALAPALSVNPDGRMVLCSTPSFALGHYYRVWTEAPEEEWLKIKVIATECPRITPERLASEKAILGPLFSSEYMGEFVMMGQYGVFSLADIYSALVDIDPDPVMGEIHL